MQTTNQKGIVKLTKAQYNTLVTTGSVTDGAGNTFTYQDGYIYCTDEVEYVSFAEPQLLTPEQQAQARANIGAGSGGGGTEVYVNGVLQQTLNFNSDPQTQISGKVPTSRTIAGVDLVDNITKSELLTALNVEDGAEVNEVNDVEIDDVSCVTGTTAEIRTINGDYNASTNRLATDSDISGKVGAVNTAKQIYGTGQSGQQTTYPIGETADAGSIPIRLSGGKIYVGDPSNEGHATNKKYVDGLSMIPTDTFSSISTPPSPGNYYFVAPSNGVAYIRHKFSGNGWVGFHLMSVQGVDLAFNTQYMSSNNNYGSCYNATFVMKKGQGIFCYEVNNAVWNWGGLTFVPSGV